jgi:uncharacterized membrane protein
VVAHIPKVLGDGVFLAIGLAAGLAFGVASAFANRLWGTVLACIPIGAWFVTFGVLQQGGYTNREAMSLASLLFGIILGSLIGPGLTRLRRRQGPRR